jgi:hypothetical protein
MILRITVAPDDSTTWTVGAVPHTLLYLDYHHNDEDDNNDGGDDYCNDE